MKILRFNDWSTGVLLEDQRVLDVDETVWSPSFKDADVADTLRPLFQPETADWVKLISEWDTAGQALTALVAHAAAEVDGIVLHDLGDVELHPPLPSRHARIFALGANFADHSAAAQSMVFGRQVTEDEVLAEKSAGLPPWGFTVIPQTVVAAGTDIEPPGYATMLDYEAEVAVVLRSGGRALESNGLDVWGFTAWNDISVRDHFFGVGPAIDRGIMAWALQKNFETSNPCGPWITVDEPFDVGSLRMQTRVNGETRQDSSTSKMIYSFGETVEHLSAFLLLKPGDMLVSGTPSGTAVESGQNGPFLRDGDEVEVEIEGVGTLRNTVRMSTASRS